MVKEEEEELPDPVRRMGAWRDTTEPQESRNPPRASPKVEVGDRGPEDGLSGRRQGGAGRQNVRDVVVAGTTKTAVRRSGPANPLKIRVEKKTVAVASKTRKFTTHSTREGQLLRCYFGDLEG